MQKNENKKNNVVSDILQQLAKQKELINRSDVNPAYLFFFVGLSLIAVIFEGISLGFLVPVVKGIIEMDFGFTRGLPLINRLVAAFPRLFTRPNSSVFILLIGIIFMATVMKNIFLYFSAIGVDYQARRVASSMRKKVMNRYLSFGKLFFDKSVQGALNARVMNFTDAVALNIRQMFELLKWFFLLVMYSILMFAISWKLTVFTIVIPPIIFYSSKWIIEKIGRTSRYYTQYRSTLFEATHNILSCISLIKLYSNEMKELEKFGYTSDCVATFEFSMDKKERLIPLLQEIVLMTVILLLISIMAYLIVRERTGEISGFLVFFYLIRRAAGAVMVISKAGGTVAKASGPTEELLKVFDDSDKVFVPEGKKVFEGLKRKIEFNKLSFSYVPEVKVLKDISFVVEKGKITAIVGPTGAGKTTLVHLLLRYYDCPPSTIFMDNTDIREFTSKSLRAHMAFVSQETQLFNDTLRANIAYGLSGIDEKALIEAAKKARIYGFIRKLPKGFDTLIGERGVKLSGGERQRVSIARALLKGAEILILDEATSSLDSITERLIQEAIDEAVKDRTAIVIAHRLSTIRNADLILVIEDGRLVEEGTLDELLKRKNIFYKYWNEQIFY